MNPNANQIKNEKGYALRTPRYDRIYLFYERGNTVHSYRFINEDEEPAAAKDMLFAYRDKYTQVKMTVSRFDYLFRRQLFAIEKLKEPTLPDKNELAKNRSCYFSYTHNYTEEELDSLVIQVEDMNFDDPPPKNGKTAHFANERNYTKEQLDSLITNIEDIEF